MSASITKIDSITIQDHSHLEEGDECYYFYEYTRGKDFTFSQTNNLIGNLKKSPTYRARPDVWKHKLRAISGCAEVMGSLLNPAFLKKATFVPVPPSKRKDHPDYDDRMLEILKRIDVGYPIDIREIVRQNVSMEASHTSATRVTVSELLDAYEIDESLTSPAPTSIAVFDDVLTAGTHFRAMSQVLVERFPGVPIYGLFIARRIFPPVDTI